MAMIRVQPVEIQVRADWFDGRPRELTKIANFSLSFRHRSRRWTIEGMDEAARAA